MEATLKVMQPERPSESEESSRAAGSIVWIVDDDSDARERIAAAATRYGAEARCYSDAALFLREFDSQQPGCLVFDAQLPGATGLKLLDELAARYMRVPMIATLGHVDVELVVRLMRTGAFDALEKPILQERLVQAISQAVAHDREQRQAAHVHEEIRQRAKRLTRRERQVLELVMAGMGSKAIAAALELCERTIEIYRSRIKKKMQTRNAADLVRQMNLASEGLRADSAPPRCQTGAVS
jgi:FixJ family two-component response regulator